ncbi:hypothetical protein GGF46_002610 [Coemansia sp. RSA 552]|nr:hypothetical protein GGF46_002610 [Coemansia sp. RSA 552]
MTAESETGGGVLHPKGHSMQPSPKKASPEKAGRKAARSGTVDPETMDSKAVRQVAIRTFGYEAPYSSGWRATRGDWLALAVLSVLAIAVRCFRLAEPGEVVFDEVHFGKFAGRYLNRTYFYDLHPPLAKMMFAAAGRLAGYDGVFDFKSIGLDYGAAGVPYVGMRLLPAMLGAATVPLAYVAGRACGYAADTAVLAAFMVCLENGLVTQSRLILLDSPLVFFTALTLVSWCVFWAHQGRPFTRGWWAWLTATGVAMGCAASCKWVGLFLIPAIGLSTVTDLWDKVADRGNSVACLALHFVARAWGLIVVPVAVYLAWFGVHFAVLHRMGPDAAVLTPEFRASLTGAPNPETDRDVFYGSEIRMRASNANSGFIHSHQHAWKHAKGSGQQQVTLYGHADPNNIWVVEPGFNHTVDEATRGSPARVRSGDVVRFRHKVTGRYLHSHNKPTAMSSSEKTRFEISAYGGFKNFSGDANDNFLIDVTEGSGGDVQAIYSRFRLYHPFMKCHVFNSRKKLPKWGYGQIELHCMQNCQPRMSTWHIEYARHPTRNATRKAAYRPLGLWGKVVEYNRLMADSNEKLTGDHPFAARPHHWPWLRRGTAYWGGVGRVVYQLGNPLVWWGSLVAVLGFMSIRLSLFLLDKRRIHLRLGGGRRRYLSAAGFFVVAWACHYLPFFLMGRELFIHHYFPALWMAIMVLAFTVDLATASMSRSVRRLSYLGVAVAVLYAFHTFSYITYARVWTKDTCLRAKWLSTWDIDCEHAVGGSKAVVTSPASDSSTSATSLVDSAAKASGESEESAVYVSPEMDSLLDSSLLVSGVSGKVHEEL